MKIDANSFNDIRPYNNDEVRPVIDRLLTDDEFVDAIAFLQLPDWLKGVKRYLRPLVRRRLTSELKYVRTVEDLQKKIERYLGDTIERTTLSWEISGLDKLNKQSAYLFVSNHRDISMDPAFVNWSLHTNNHSTLRIAIGDNLLTKPFASDLMRLNKCFIVNRSATAPREKLKAAKLLSQYIRYSIQDDAENIWIAQREGRARH